MESILTEWLEQSSFQKKIDFYRKHHTRLDQLVDRPAIILICLSRYNLRVNKIYFFKSDLALTLALYTGFLRMLHSGQKLNQKMLHQLYAYPFDYSKSGQNLLVQCLHKYPSIKFFF